MSDGAISRKRTLAELAHGHLVALIWLLSCLLGTVLAVGLKALL